jgi:TfoX/Sxy family transcriptional regulator of competence genes
MFGEYGVYVGGKMIRSVCDDQLFADSVSEAPPYPGAKAHLLIQTDRWKDAEWFGELLRVTAAELPPPKPRKPKPGT